MADYKSKNVLDSVVVSDYLDSNGIEYRVTHGSSGQQLNVETCPVCGNSNYKVFLNAENGLGNCFSGSCETKFNLFTFIKEYWGYIHPSDVFQDAEKHVKAHRFVKRKPKLVKEKIVPTDLALPSHCYPLPHNGRNLTYLTNRGVDAATAKKFELHYAHKGFFEYRDSEGNYKQQPYHSRVVSPIRDIGGKLVSFQGRDTTGIAERKYLFPPGFASTQVLLYNIHNVIGNPDVLICEGVYDVIAASLALPTVGVVGTFGKHIGHTIDDREDQVVQLRRLRTLGMERLTIMWDGNRSPLKSAVDEGLMLTRKGFKVSIAMLPYDKDPAEIPASVVEECYREAQLLTRASAARLLTTGFRKYKS